MAGAGQYIGTAMGQTPEERQLKNERKRIESMIRSYQRRPENYNPQMLASLERMATQYGIPFSAYAGGEKASFVENTGAFLGGIGDAILLDFVPDDWYSSDKTNRAKNWGKGIGTVGTLAATMGASGIARGAAAIGTKATSAIAKKQASRIAGRTQVIPGTPTKPAVPFKPVKGNAKQRRKAQRKHDRNPDNQRVEGTPDIQYSNIADKPSKAGQAFDDFNPEQIKGMADSLGEGVVKAGEVAGFTPQGALGSFGFNSIKRGIRDIGIAKGWSWAKKSVVDDAVKAIKSGKGADISDVIAGAKLDTDDINTITKAIRKQYGSKKVGRTLIAEVKGSGTAFSSTSDDILKFVDNIGGKKKVTKKAIQEIGKKSKMSAAEIKELTEQILNNQIDNFDDVAKFLIGSTKTPSVDILKTLQNKDLWMGAGATAVATSPVTGLNPFGEGLTKSREEKMEEMYDPLNTAG